MFLAGTGSRWRSIQRELTAKWIFKNPEHAYQARMVFGVSSWICPTKEMETITSVAYPQVLTVFVAGPQTLCSWLLPCYAVWVNSHQPLWSLREGSLRLFCWAPADKQKLCHSVNVQKLNANVLAKTSGSNLTAVGLRRHHLKFWHSLRWVRQWWSFIFGAEIILRGGLGISILVLAPMKTWRSIKAQEMEPESCVLQIFIIYYL